MSPPDMIMLVGADPSMSWVTKISPDGLKRRQAQPIIAA